MKLALDERQIFEQREYQTECKEAIKVGRDAGLKAVLVVLPTGCHAPGTEILMYDGTIKLVEDVSVGDLLMGPDSGPRVVLDLHEGNDEMFEIRPVKGQPFVVNARHILSLRSTNEGKKCPSSKTGREIVNISVSDYVEKCKYFKHVHKLYRAKVEFSAFNSKLEVDPYFLGTYLGDGCTGGSGSIRICTPDMAIVDEIYHQAEEWGLAVREEIREDRAPQYFLVTHQGNRGGNKLKNALRKLSLAGLLSAEKFVPHAYKTASRENRLNLLAGLLDTDGSLSGSGFDFISKSKQLAQDVAFISRSLGLAAYVAETTKTGFGVTGIYYRVSISGDCSIIPTRIKRKQAAPRQQKKNPLVTGLSVEPVGFGQYFGFTVDSDNLYLMGDFTVSHNSGKTVIFSHLPEVLELKKKTLVIAHRAELLNQAADKIERANPDLAVYIEQAHRRAPYYADVVVASVATIGRKGSTRLSKLDPDDFGLIICDEAHHSPAKSYGIIFDHFPDAFLVGFTATPRRADGIGLEHIYQEIVFSRDLKWMIEHGYLSPVCGYSVDSGTDLSAVSTRMGDFAVNELAQAVDTDKRNQLILDSYHHLVPGQKALIFCVDVNHAHHVAEMFNRTGVPAAAITGSTLALERELLLQDFSRGEIQVLSNCMVLCEGYDEPSVEAVILARPTKSTTLYCLDQQTEILTPAGFVGPDSVNVGDLVAAFDPATEAIKWVPATGKIVRPLAGDEKLYELKSPGIDLRVSDRHRMLWRSPASPCLDWNISEARQLAKRPSEYHLPVAGLEDAAGVPLTDDELRFIGWFITDGNYNRLNGTIRIAQAHHQPHHDAIVSCLKGCGFKYGVYVQDRKTSFSKASRMITYTVSRGAPRGRDKHLRGWGHLNLYIDKQLAPALEDMTKEQLAVLLEAIHLGDGSKQLGQTWTRQSYHISTGNKTFADRLQGLCVRRGYRCNIAEHSYNQQSIYLLHIKPGLYRHVGGSCYTDRPTLKQSPATKGESVWCVENEIGTLVTRRNGKVVVVGNCQMIGRGMRLHPGKEKLTVVDLADNASRHSLLSLATIFGLPARFNAKGHNILEAAKKLEDMPPHLARKVRNFEDFEKLVKEIDLFAVAPERDPEIVRYSRMAWLSMPNGAYRLGLKDKQYLRIHENLLGKFIVSHCGAGVDQIGEESSLKAALNLGDGWLVRNRQEELVLTDANASWRSKEPKQPQIDLLNRLGIPYKCDQDGKPALTRGQASDLIGEFYAKRKRR